MSTFDLKRLWSGRWSRILVLSFAVTTWGVAAPSTNAQSVYDVLRFTQRYPGTGARMMGMGGAGIAGIADYSALFTNPAGLGYFDKSAISGSLGTFTTTDDAHFTATDFSNRLENDLSGTGLNHFAYIGKAPTARGSLVFGIAFNQVNTFGRELRFSGQNANNSITDFFMPIPGEFEITEDVDNGEVNYNVDWFRDISYIAYETYGIDFDQGLYESGDAVPFLPAVTAGTVDQEGSVLEEGSMKEINIGGAFEASPRLMVGASANLLYGAYDYKRVFDEFDTNNQNNGSNGTTDFDNLRLEERFESNLVGVNARLGVSGEVGNGLRLGLTVETPSYYSVNEEYNTALETWFDNGDYYSYGLDAGDDVGTGEYEYSITTPWRLGAGIGFDQRNFTVNADVEFVDWTQLRLNDPDDEDLFDDLNQDIRDNLKSVFNARIGAEYRISGFALRGGVAFQPSPWDIEFEKADGSEVNMDQVFYSAGLGYRVNNQFQIDFGWMQSRFEDSYSPYELDTNAPVVDEELTRNRFSVGVSVFF